MSVTIVIAGTITGKVINKDTGKPLVGANVYLQGTTLGAATDIDGMFRIETDDGTYYLVCDYVGFAQQKVNINLTGNLSQDFELVEYLFAKTIDVFADRARERETPVAFTNVSKQEIEERLGSQDIPLVLNVTPSVFATVNGGGAGDSRVNVRGFNQRNTAIMINGVPINDMENGWLYWSNWDGVADATSSIQMQRGLSAVNLATPSIGGTMNILTDPSAHTAGFMYKNEIGSGRFTKNTMYAHTGLINNKFALSFGGVRKTGEGFVDKAWTDSWAYYLGSSYQLDNDNRFEFYATGAPQRHGQRRWRLNAATFSHELARDLGYSETVLKDIKFAEQGLRYNSNWNSVSSSYADKQYWNESVSNRHSANFTSESENFYHKPIINFNWFSQLTDDLSLYSTVYWSGGEGGGTGTFGSLKYDYSLLQRVVDWDATIASNRGHTVDMDLNNTGDTTTYIVSTDRRNDPDFARGGILRNSRNNQSTIGAIAKFYYRLSEELNTSFGLDWRTAEIEHYREVRDLLGNDFFHFTGNEFDNARQQFKTLGDKIDYNFTNTVNWIGAYGQGEYTANKYTFYGMAGLSMIKYDHTNHFMKDTDGSETFIETDNITGGQVKGGVSYRLDDNTDVYTNLGYISKVPLLDAVINDYRSELIKDHKNETFYSFEVGTNLKLLDRTLSLGGNLYYTVWNDRSLTQTEFENTSGVEGLVVVTGLDATHTGIELNGAFQPVNYARIDVAASIGNWENGSDANASYKPYSAGISDSSFTTYTNGIKVGDAPQTQLAASFTLLPARGMSLQAIFRYYDNYYADWNAFSRGDASDKAQSWKIPSYNIVDVHFAYRLPLKINGVGVSLNAHIFNLLNELYVQDATDNSQYNSWYHDDNGNFEADPGEFYEPHKASAAEVYPGLPTTYNIGVTFTF